MMIDAQKPCCADTPREDTGRSVDDHLTYIAVNYFTEAAMLADGFRALRLLVQQTTMLEGA